MTIADNSRLAKAVTWEVTARPAGNDVVQEVQFLIDGKKMWAENVEPYVFGEDGQLLTPWLLSDGAHELSAHVVTIDGATADVTAHVGVRAKVGDTTSIAGTYTRVVSKADQRRVTAYRTPDKGAFGDLSPVGKWTMTIKPDGRILLRDPLGDPQNPTVEPFTVSGSTMRVYGSAVWAQRNPEDASKFCEPEAASDYRVQLSGSTLTISNVQKACADRDIAFVGTWTRR